MRSYLFFSRLSALFYALVLSCAVQAAESVYDLPSSEVAIQARRYQMNHSVLVSAGYMPTDSFNRGYPLTGAYRYALASYLTLEGSFSWVLNQKTSLEDEFNALNVQVQNIGLGGVLDYPRQIYMLGVHYSPMYSKSLLFNSQLVYSETSLFLGTGSLNFNQVGYKVMLAPGISTRLYMGPKTALVGYFRDYFYSDDQRGITGIIDFGVGFEYKLNSERSSSEKTTAN
jgi:outer membrane beta-barrel protein